MPFKREGPGCDVLVIMKKLAGKKVNLPIFVTEYVCIYIYVYVCIYLSTTEWMTICLPRVEMGDDTRPVFSPHKNW